MVSPSLCGCCCCLTNFTYVDRLGGPCARAAVAPRPAPGAEGRLETGENMAKNRERTPGRALLTLEVLVSSQERPDWLEVVVSLSEREGTFSRSWGTPGKHLSHTDLNDFMGWLEDMTTAAWAAVGIQLELFVTD